MPVAMSGEVAADGWRRFRVHVLDDGARALQVDRDGEFVPLYRFDLVRFGQADAELGHFYSHRHPEATFVNNLVASRILDDEIRSLRNREYVVITSAGQSAHPVDDASDLHRILVEELGLEVDEAEADRLFGELPRGPERSWARPAGLDACQRGLHLAIVCKPRRRSMADPPATRDGGRAPAWTDGKRYLWLVALTMPMLPFAALGLQSWTGWGIWLWLGPIVILGLVPLLDLAAGLDRSNPPDGVIAAPRARPLLPVAHLRLPAAAVRGIRRGVLVHRHRGTRRRGQGRTRGHRRLRRGPGHQHGSRAGTQAREPRTMAGEGRAGPELLRALLHRAQPRPPRAGGHAPGPGQQSPGRELLRVLAAHGARLPCQCLATRAAAVPTSRARAPATRQRRAERVAHVGAAVGRHDRVAGRRHRALPRHPGRWWD